MDAGDWFSPSVMRWFANQPDKIMDAPCQHDDSLPPTACDLKCYVHHNKPSIFVGTTQPYRTADGRLTSWRRRVTCRNLCRYKYKIFAYRGVAVNRVTIAPQRHTPHCCTTLLPMEHYKSKTLHMLDCMTDTDGAIPKHTPASSRKTSLKSKSTPPRTKSTSNHPQCTSGPTKQGCV